MTDFNARAMTRREWSATLAMMHGAPYFQAAEAAASTALAHPEIDWDEKRTFAEWLDGITIKEDS